MLLFPGWGGGVGGMEENKKSGVGDVRAKALSWDIEWEKAKNVLFGFFPLAPPVAQCAPFTSLAARKKSRFAKKKSAPPKKNTPAANTLQHRMEGMPLHPHPQPTQCYPLDSFYSPPHSTIRQRIKCRGAIFCARPSLPTARVFCTIGIPSADAGAKYCAPTSG